MEKRQNSQIQNEYLNYSQLESLKMFTVWFPMTVGFGSTLIFFLFFKLKKGLIHAVTYNILYILLSLEKVASLLYSDCI